MDHCTKIFESWGLRVELGAHVFSEFGYLAGRDEERLADINQALRDPGIRAIFATRGGKGSYRIADKLDFVAAANDPKFLIGFSDITALHLALWKECRLAGIHGPLASWSDEFVGSDSVEALRRAVMTSESILLKSDPLELTSSLTTRGRATGVLIGGNLDTLAICAGWALPSLEGSILLVEAVAGSGLGQIDRHLTMLAKAGHLKGLRGIAVGQFTNFETSGNWTVIDVLRDHFDRCNVPILGGLPFGHGKNPRTVPIGTVATLDAERGTLDVLTGARSRA